MVTYRNNLVLVSIGLILLAGCAGMKTEGSRTAIARKPPSDITAMRWRAVRFQNGWPEGASAEWYIDALIAHRVVAPILERYRNQIPLWRFHRRAARDKAGHLFSFIFYTDSVSAQRVIDAVQNDSLVTEMLQAGSIVRVFADGNGQITKPGIGDTSDQNWSPIVRNTWPYFIMGVSKTWLEMIAAEADRRQLSAESASIENLMAQYRNIDNKVRQAWQSEGHHAFLHHLNAVFGYAPVIVGQDVLMKF